MNAIQIVLATVEGMPVDPVLVLGGVVATLASAFFGVLQKQMADQRRDLKEVRAQQREMDKEFRDGLLKQFDKSNEGLVKIGQALETMNVRLTLIESLVRWPGRMDDER